MVRNEVEKLVSAYLVQLEEFDDLQTGEVIIKSFEQSFTGKELNPAPTSNLVAKFVERKAYLSMENDFIEWSKKRLENWYILKLNALRAALEHDLVKNNAAQMALDAIKLTRNGTRENISLNADAYFLQGLANNNIKLNFNLPWETYEQEKGKRFSKKEKIFVETVLNKAFKQIMPERREEKRGDK